MGIAGKVTGMLRRQGVRALCYVISQKLKNRLSEQQKYAQYVRQERKRFHVMMQKHKGTDCVQTDGVCAHGIQEQEPLFALLHVDEDIFSAIEEAKAPYLAFAEDGMMLSDEWQTLAGAWLKRHPQCRFLYTDEDVCEMRRTRPVFKPDWSPDTYLSYDYIGGLLIMERSLAVKVKEQIFHGYRESFLYELGLRAAWQLEPEEIGHLDEVLCHREQQKKEVPKEQLMKLKEEILRARGLHGHAVWCEEAHVANVVYEPPQDALVSIIVPSKDHVDILKTCMESVENNTDYAHVEWIIVDNGSAAAQKVQYEALCADAQYPCTYVYEPMPFNFSKMCNIGAQAAKGQYLLFLNDDMELPVSWPSMHHLTEETQRNWLSVFVGQAACAHIGAVGAKLLYPDSDLIQHLGVVNYTSGAAHLLWQAKDSGRLSFDRNLTNQNYAVVTAACFMVSADKFAKVGGFEEQLAVTFNDVELCLRLLKAGYYNVVRSDVVLYHHESLSRGQDVLDEAKFLRGLKERECMFDLHPDLIGVDPFYSRHLTQTRLDHLLDYPQPLVYANEKKSVQMPQAAETKNRRAGAVPENAGGADAAAWEAAKDRVAGESEIVARILRVRCEDELTIEGWAYRPGHASERVTVWLTDESGVSRAYTTQAVYSPTLATEQQRTEKLFFSEFLMRLPAASLKPGMYRISLQIADSRKDTGCTVKSTNS